MNNFYYPSLSNDQVEESIRRLTPFQMKVLEDFLTANSDRRHGLFIARSFPIDYPETEG